MRSFFEWFEREIDWKRPWLVLGKGPTFSHYSEFEKEIEENYYTIGMNHIARERKVFVTHVADIIRIHEIPDLFFKTKYLLMPWHPHKNWSPMRATLEETVEEDSVLEQFNENNRLLWYNLASWPDPHPDAPKVEIKFFSTEAIVSLLGLAGVKKIRTLGVDGGSEYAEEFSDLTPPAMHLHSTYSHQLPVLDSLAERFKLDYGPLSMEKVP